MLHRRTVLKAAGGIALGLPWLEAMAAGPTKGGAQTPPRRIGFIGHNNGNAMRFWQPRTPGKDYKMPYALQALEPLRGQLNVYTGLDTQHTIGGHGPDSLLTSNLGNETPGYKWRQSASIDQVIANTAYGRQARFPALNLSVNGAGIYSRVAFNNEGVVLPTIGDPKDLYEQLFVSDDPKTVDTRIQRLKKDKLLLDAVLDDAKRLQQKLGTADQRKIDQYLSAIRGVEQELAREEAWMHTPKPGAAMPKAAVQNEFSRVALFYDLLALALQTDSTRVFTFWAHVETSSKWGNHHGGSHSVGGDIDNLEELPKAYRNFVEFNKEYVDHLAPFFQKLANMPEGDGSVLDHSAIFFGSMIRQDNHYGQSIPLLSCGSLGGRLKTGSHVELSPFPYGGELDSKLRANYKGRPIGTLHLTLLRQLGLEAEGFGVGTMRSTAEIGEILV